MNEYTITVITSNIKYAGTDANVYIELFGTNGKTGRIFLEKSLTNFNKFERGQKDVFKIKSKDVGDLEKIKIGHDNRNIGAGWHLNQVLIESLDGQMWCCEFNQWFDKSSGDRLIERESIVSKIQEQALCSYEISITTSNLRMAGTDANVFIKIFGPNLQTDEILLSRSINHRNKFEAGNTDVFKIRELDVGDIKKIRIGHDNTGLCADWHLKEVVIKKSDKKIWEFSCNKWFSSSEDDRLIERDLYPLEYVLQKSIKPHNLIGYSIKYEINVRTLNTPNSGTDANVYLKMYGDIRHTEFIELKNSLSHFNKFEKGNSDIFSIKEVYIGELKKIEITHDNTGFLAGWFLNEIIIESADLGRQWVFPCNRWLSKDELDGKTSVILEPTKMRLTTSESNYKTYIIEVFTGDLPEAGTNANVFITLYGKNGDTSENYLENSETNIDKFERNSMDRFIIKTFDIGKIKEIRIRHDNTGIFSEWFLDRVEVTDSETSEKYYFVCNDWIAKYNLEKRIRGKRHIYWKYFLKIYYKKRDPNETNLDIFIQLKGANETSKEFKLDKDNVQEANEDFDLFIIETNENLGSLYNIDFKINKGIAKTRKIYIKKVQIIDGDKFYEFEYNDYLC